MGDHLVIGARSGGADEPEDRLEGGPGSPGAPGTSGDPGASGVPGEGRDSGGSGGPGGSGASDGSPARTPKQRSFWKELPILVVVALVLALIIKTFLVQAFSIPSGSMENTLRINDRVLVDKLTPALGAKPSRGQVVVFHDPGDWLADEPTAQPSSNALVRWIQEALSLVGLMPDPNEKDLIKRVIAVGGDTVSCAGGNSPVYVNGKALNEPYIFPGATPCGDKPFGPLKVPQGYVWVMGDHRNDSADSRYHMDEPGGGAVPDSDVVGRAIVVAWPVSHWATLPIPSTFSQPGITDQALGVATSPGSMGLVGALPVTYVYRRLRLRRLGRRAAGADAGAGAEA